MSIIEPKKNYTTQEVADVLRLSPAWVRQKIMQKKLPVVRIGRRVFVKGATILDIYKNGFAL